MEENLLFYFMLPPAFISFISGMKSCVNCSPMAIIIEIVRRLLFKRNMFI